ncbi:MerR family transcriptional regulator [Sphingomonas sp.]|uniref:MerR family transcriptional regulator n=1 Tax=Sphingomonas sp. TaxID=28214 RepID=UPI001EC578A4|nr:MerR family transcriptional regulator [Sphingomonas sp.]MBX3594203.1 MerR family transcriptional regulator [Sphingomonas sp.]
MDDSLDIADVARRTGISARALRFYEARGLLAPLRTQSGRRRYGPAELARLHQILTLKRAGLTLAQVQRLLARRALDLGQLIDAQLSVLDEQAAAIARARRLLADTRSRVERSEPLDIATFCSLIEQGEQLVSQQEQWDKVTSRYFTDTEKAQFAQAAGTMPADFDQQAYAAKWQDIGARIKAALPLDPASDQAQAFYAEWCELLAPFNAVATPAMKAGVQRMYEDMGNWQEQAGARPDPGFDAEVFQFIQAAGRARHAAG